MWMVLQTMIYWLIKTLCFPFAGIDYTIPLMENQFILILILILNKTVSFY